MSDARSNSYVFSINKPLKVLVCTITLMAFFINIFAYDLAWAAGTPSGLTSVGSDRAGSSGVSSFAKASEDRFKELNVNTFILPEYLGHIKDSWAPNSRLVDGQKIVIHIQDAHCNYYAQRKIAEIVEYLNKEYGINTVNLEGGAKDYDLSVFTDIKDTAIRAEAADYFVKEGLVNGAEYFAINNPEKISLWGAEDTGLYIENLKAYRNSLMHKEEIEEHLKALQHILSNLKIHIYSKGLLEFDMKYSAYKADNLEFKDYLNYLIAKTNDKAIDIKSLSNIYLLNKALNEESGIDFKRANNERDALVDKLRKKLSRNSLTELVKRSVEFKSGRISQKDFYAYLAGRARAMNIELKGFGNLEKYIKYVSVYEAIDNIKIMDELETLENKIKEALFENEKQRELASLSKNLALTKNIFNISITKDDYRYYLKNAASFDMRNYTKFIDREAPLYKITAKLGERISGLDDYREDILKFYEYSMKRDIAFINNMKLSAFGRQPLAQRAIFVTGGFHTDSLAELFRKNNISYISIMPNFKNREGYECPYFKIISGEKSLKIKDTLPTVVKSCLATASQLCPEIARAAEMRDVTPIETVPQKITTPATPAIISYTEKPVMKLHKAFWIYRMINMLTIAYFNAWLRLFLNLHNETLASFIAKIIHSINSPFYQRDLSLIRGMIGRNKTKDIKIIYYPGIGHDAATAIEATGANMIIGVDPEPGYKGNIRKIIKQYKAEILACGGIVDINVNEEEAVIGGTGEKCKKLTFTFNQRQAESMVEKKLILYIADAAECFPDELKNGYDLYMEKGMSFDESGAWINTAIKFLNEGGILLLNNLYDQEIPAGITIREKLEIHGLGITEVGIKGIPAAPSAEGAEKIPAKGRVMMEAMKARGEYYSKKSMKDGREVVVNSPDSALKFANERVARKEKFAVTMNGRPILIKGRPLEAIVEEGVGITGAEIGELIQEALARSKGANLNNLPTARNGNPVLIIALLDSSTHIFEDHIANGFIGINSSLYNTARINPNITKLIKKIGLFHELSHELTGGLGNVFEREQLQRDARYAAKFIKEENIDILQFSDAVKLLTASRKFMREVANILVKKETLPVLPLPVSQLPIANQIITEIQPPLIAMPPASAYLNLVIKERSFLDRAERIIKYAIAVVVLIFGMTVAWNWNKSTTAPIFNLAQTALQEAGKGVKNPQVVDMKFEPKPGVRIEKKAVLPTDWDSGINGKPAGSAGIGETIPYISPTYSSDSVVARVDGEILGRPFREIYFNFQANGEILKADRFAIKGIGSPVSRTRIFYRQECLGKTVATPLIYIRGVVDSAIVRPIDEKGNRIGDKEIQCRVIDGRFIEFNYKGRAEMEVRIANYENTAFDYEQKPLPEIELTDFPHSFAEEIISSIREGLYADAAKKFSDLIDRSDLSLKEKLDLIASADFIPVETKLRAIADTMNKHCYYNGAYAYMHHNGRSWGSTWQGIIDSGERIRLICDTSSRMFALLCQRMGIRAGYIPLAPLKIVSGYIVYGGIPHAMVTAEIDGKWYMVETTELMPMEAGLIEGGGISTVFKGAVGGFSGNAVFELKPFELHPAETKQEEEAVKQRPVERKIERPEQTRSGEAFLSGIINDGPKAVTVEKINTWKAILMRKYGGEEPSPSLIRGSANILLNVNSEIRPIVIAAAVDILKTSDLPFDSYYNAADILRYFGSSQELKGLLEWRGSGDGQGISSGRKDIIIKKGMDDGAYVCVVSCLATVSFGSEDAINSALGMFRADMTRLKLEKALLIEQRYEELYDETCYAVALISQLESRLSNASPSLITSSLIISIADHLPRFSAEFALDNIAMHSRDKRIRSQAIDLLIDHLEYSNLYPEAINTIRHREAMRGLYETGLMFARGKSDSPLKALSEEQIQDLALSLSLSPDNPRQRLIDYFENNEMRITPEEAAGLIALCQGGVRRGNLQPAAPAAEGAEEKPAVTTRGMLMAAAAGLVLTIYSGYTANGWVFYLGCATVLTLITAINGLLNAVGFNGRIATAGERWYSPQWNIFLLPFEKTTLWIHEALHHVPGLKSGKGAYGAIIHAVILYPLQFALTPIAAIIGAAFWWSEFDFGTLASENIVTNAKMIMKNMAGKKISLWDIPEDYITGFRRIITDLVPIDMIKEELKTPDLVMTVSASGEIKEEKNSSRPERAWLVEIKKGKDTVVAVSIRDDRDGGGNSMEISDFILKIPGKEKRPDAPGMNPIVALTIFQNLRTFAEEAGYGRIIIRVNLLQLEMGGYHLIGAYEWLGFEVMDTVGGDKMPARMAMQELKTVAESFGPRAKNIVIDNAVAEKIIGNNRLPAHIFMELPLAQPGASAFTGGPKAEMPEPKLPDYTGAGDTSIHAAVMTAGNMIDKKDYLKAAKLLTELNRDLEVAERSENIESLMEKWNKRYPSTLEVDFRMGDIQALRMLIERILISISKYYVNNAPEHIYMVIPAQYFAIIGTMPDSRTLISWNFETGKDGATADDIILEYANNGFVSKLNIAGEPGDYDYDKQPELIRIIYKGVAYSLEDFRKAVPELFKDELDLYSEIAFQGPYLYRAIGDTEWDEIKEKGVFQIRIKTNFEEKIGTQVQHYAAQPGYAGVIVRIPVQGQYFSRRLYGTIESIMPHFVKPEILTSKIGEPEKWVSVEEYLRMQAAQPAPSQAVPAGAELEKYLVDNIGCKDVAEIVLPSDAAEGTAYSAYESDILNKARNGYAIKLNVSELSAISGDGQKISTALKGFALRMTQTFDDIFGPDVDVMAYNIKEVLKNALWHGNKFDLNLPIYLRVDLEKGIVEVYDTASRSDKRPKSLTNGEYIFGDGAGLININKNGFDFIIEKNIKNTSNAVVGTRVIIRKIGPATPASSPALAKTEAEDVTLLPTRAELNERDRRLSRLMPASYIGENPSLENLTGEATRYYNIYKKDTAVRNALLIAGDLALQALNKIVTDKVVGKNIGELLPILEAFEREAYDKSGSIKALIEFIRENPTTTTANLPGLETNMDTVDNMNERTELSVRILSHEPGHNFMQPTDVLWSNLGVINILSSEKDSAVKDISAQPDFKKIFEDLLSQNVRIIYLSWWRIQYRKAGKYDARLPTMTASEAAEWRRLLYEIISYKTNSDFKAVQDAGIQTKIGNDAALISENIRKSYAELLELIEVKMLPLIKGSPAIETLDLKAIARNACEKVLSGERIPQNTVQLEFVPPEGDIVMHADRNHIRQILGTLMRNSIQVAKERLEDENAERAASGLALLTLEDRPIHLKVSLQRGEDGTLNIQLLEVCDNVGGVSDAELLKETKPESKRQNVTRLNTSRRKKDTGFGLAYVWHVANIHGGTFWIRNIDDTPGQGIIASIRIPMPFALSAETAAPAPSQATVVGAKEAALFKGNINDRPYFSTVRNRKHYDEFVKAVINHLLAIRELIDNGTFERRFTTTESVLKEVALREKYGINDKFEYEMKEWVERVEDNFGKAGVGYAPKRGFSYEAIDFVYSLVLDHYLQFADISNELEIVYEIASHKEIPINNRLRQELRNITGYLKTILNRDNDDGVIYEELKKKSDTTRMLLLRWLGNIAELDSSPNEQEKAREFLSYFVRRYLDENKDILNDFADFVFEKVSASHKGISTSEGSEDVSVAIMLTGAQHLGYWLRARAQALKKDIIFQDLLLTRSMVLSLEHEYDAERTFLPNKSKDLLLKYLYEKGVMSDKTRHIIFVDTAGSGSLNEILRRVLRDKGVGDDYLLLFQRSAEWDEHLASGLNKQAKWKNSQNRLGVLSSIMDDGFEASMTSPTRFTNGIQVTTLPTSRPWFYNLIKDEINKIAGGAKENTPDQVEVAKEDSPEDRMVVTVAAFTKVNGRDNDVKIVIGVPDGENEAKIQPTLSAINRELAKNGFGKLNDNKQVIRFELDVNNSAKTAENQQRAIQQAFEGLLPDGRVVVFSPQMEKGPQLVEAAKKVCQDRANVSIIPDAYTDFRPEENIPPDIMIRVALGRHIAFYCSAKDESTQRDALDTINKLLTKVADGVTLDELLKMIKTLRIRPVDYKDIEQWQIMQQATATSA